MSLLVNDMYDIFFISYDEPNADHNWDRLRSIMPHARRVHGIQGIHNAHRRCAELAYTEMFWTVDGDTVADDSFEFNHGIPPWDRKYLHLWYSRNPVNDLAYGYGAIKLWPRSAVIGFDKNWLDFTTSVGNIKIVDQVVATTVFNTDAYSAWKSGFREAIKLCYNVANGDDESLDRLIAWLTVANDVPFAEDVTNGATAAVDYFTNNRHDVLLLKKINDFAWLSELFDAARYNHAAPPETNRIMLADRLKIRHV